MTIRATYRNQDVPNANRSKKRTDLATEGVNSAKAAWRKPVMTESNCGLEINCYATSSGSQQRR
jgi:hypothetical protein